MPIGVASSPREDHPVTHAAALEALFRCCRPRGNLKAWLAQHGREGLRIATYGLSSYRRLAHYIPCDAPLGLLVGVSGIAPQLIGDLHEAPDCERWQRLLKRLGVEDQYRLLRILRHLTDWRHAGARVRVALTAPLGGLMHLKVYMGDGAALVGSANFTAHGIEGDDQHELLLEVGGPSLAQLNAWWENTWTAAWPVIPSFEPPRLPVIKQRSTSLRDTKQEMIMNSGPQMLLGHWLGEWGAWALNGNGVVAYPHQCQAVEWIRPDGKAYLLGDEVGLGKTFTAALIWMRHQQLYGEKARLVYITKPSLIIDAISAFVNVLGVDEFLHTDVPAPQRANDIHPRFSIFHTGTSCWEMVADDGGRKKNRDHHVAGLLKEGRYRVRPEAFLKNKIEWLTAFAAKKLHEQINITAVSRLLDSPYTFVSIDTLRNPENPIAHVFDKMDQSSLVPLVIVDESHGLGRTTLRRSAIADLVWGPRDHAGKPSVLRSPGALVVYMTGTPVHPNESETASRLGLLDVDQDRTPHNRSYYDDVQAEPMSAILVDVRDRAVIRRKEGVTLDGTPAGLRIFPKRLVFPFQRWTASGSADETGRLPKAITETSKDVLLAIDQYVASEASHGAKLVSLIRRVLRSARQWPAIKRLVKESEARKKQGDETPLGEMAFALTAKQIEATGGEEQKQWQAMQMALEAAKIYESKLKDDRLENLTWKRGRDDSGQEEKQMLFTKVGWIATAYDSLAKGGKKSVYEATETAPGDTPEEDEDTAGEVGGSFDSVDDMLADARKAKSLAEDYLEPIRLDDDSKVRFSMLVALLEGIASLKLWPKDYDSMADEDRFGWGIENDRADDLRAALSRVQSEFQLREPWVVHARYIHSVVDTAVRLQLRYGQPGVPIVGIIIGDTPNYKRDEIKDRFGKGQLNIVCMSDAGAEGINLQRSNRIVLLDVPVSPGRIEQIAGRVHRLGSIRAAQVTLLLPPGYLGTRVFETLRKAASNVFKQVAGANLPKCPATGAENDPYYVRQLADYEARLLTAVAETSGAIRGEENRDALQQVVREPVRNGEPNTAPIMSLFRSGFELTEEQRKRFQDERVATHSALMPEAADLVDALVKFENATTQVGSSNYRVPVGMIDDRQKPEEYGDLITREQPFKVLQLKDNHRYWYGPQRFLPSDIPQEAGFEWLGVIGNTSVSNILRHWRQERESRSEEQRTVPQTWLSSALPPGKAMMFCGVTNEYKNDGSPAVSIGDKTLHVMLGFSDDVGGPALQWRPFFARGASVARATASMDTWLPEILPSLDERWAAKLIRRLVGLEPAYSIKSAGPEHQSLALVARDSALKATIDEDEGTKSWRLHKENVKEWLDAKLPGWWAGGAKLGCRPAFFLMVFGG